VAADYPADVDLEIRRVRGEDDVFTMEVAVRYDGGPWNFGVSIHEFRSGKIARETIYYPEPFEAPDWPNGGPRLPTDPPHRTGNRRRYRRSSTSHPRAPRLRASRAQCRGGARERQSSHRLSSR